MAFRPPDDVSYTQNACEFSNFGFMVNSVKYMVAIDVNIYWRVGNIVKLQPSSLGQTSLY